VLFLIAARPKASHEASAEQEQQSRRTVRIRHGRCAGDHRRLVARAGLLARITAAVRFRATAGGAIFSSWTATHNRVTSDGDEAAAYH
jgi:anti-sigma factor RsiW